MYINVKERNRYRLSTGTEAGNAEGSVFARGQIRNLFGGAESLTGNASYGTRARSTYDLSLSTPIFSDPDLVWSLGVVASSTAIPWASHDEVIKGAWTNLRYDASADSQHNLIYQDQWRQVTGLSPNASPSVRANAGDSVKSSLTYRYLLDRFDNPILPRQGYRARTTLELAGWGPLAGDVGFGKADLEVQGVTSVSVPFVRGDTGISLSTNLKGGLLYPLPATGQATAKPSRINDRFQLGGPVDVRGFKLSGLGPRDGADAVGGDVYASGGANLTLPLPRLGPDSPVRFQAFVNGGRLFALPNTSRSSDKSQSDEKPKGGSRSFRDTLAATRKELGNGLPSIAAGVGVVYAHPVARFELNFVLPLVIRKGEEARKGLQFGVGINVS